MDVSKFLETAWTLTEQADRALQMAQAEYAREDDAFDNFNVQAAILRAINPRLAAIRPQDVAMVFLVKHLISMGKGVSTREDMSGRYCDVINYIKLHYAMWIEEQEGAV